MISPVIFGLAGTELTADERDFFREADPVGFILFQRNCDHPRQVMRLVASLRETIGRADAPVLIDQEGGRVARLKPPHWRVYPSAATIAALPAAREAAFLSARLIADDLSQLGITVDCAPVLDIPVPGADAIIGDRAWGITPESVAQLGAAFCDGLMAGNVLPIIKHIPGHGRGTVDSHFSLPIVATRADELAATDFAPFRALAGMPWAMTAHIVYSAFDSDLPATLSKSVIEGVIRAGVGFDGVLVSDDLSMKALGDSLAARARGALKAGCDLVLHCNGDQTEMSEIAGAIGPLDAMARRRVDAGEARRHAPGAFDRDAAERRFDALLQGAR